MFKSIDINNRLVLKDGYKMNKWKWKMEIKERYKLELQTPDSIKLFGRKTN